MLKDIPQEERAALTALSAKTYELTDILVNVAQFTPDKKYSIKTITYHDSCSGLRELGVKQQPRTLLAPVEGVELREMNECEQCCSFGGAFALKFGEISSRIAERKCENSSASGADAVVLGDLGCMLNLLKGGCAGAGSETPVAARGGSADWKSRRLAGILPIALRRCRYWRQQPSLVGAAPPAIFVEIHGLISMAQQLFFVISVLRAMRDSEAGANARGFSRQIKRLRKDFAEFFDEHLDVFQRCDIFQ